MYFDNAEIQVKLTNSEGAVKAMVTIDFGGLVIKGYRVFEKKEDGKTKNWVKPPSYIKGSNYIPIVFMPTDEWKKLEEEIIKKYQEYYELENIDVDDEEL